MINPETYNSTSVEDMRNFLLRLPSTRDEPQLYFDALGMRTLGDQAGDSCTEKATWLTELTIKQHGSAYGDYKSVSKAPTRKAVMYVAAIHMNHDFLVVGSEINKVNEILHPARLSLQDLIGYREIESVEKAK